MDSACRDFRAHWLETASSAAAAHERSPHLDGCESCQTWVGRTHAQVAAFSQMTALQAPAELDARIFPLRPAGSAGAVEREPRWVEALRELERFDAPSVLERLVEEELADGPKAAVRRFAGSLERQRTPTALERRVFPLSVAARRIGTGILSFGAAAAAVAAVWIGLKLSQGPHIEQRSFTVHRGVPAEIHPLAAGMLPLGTPLASEVKR